MKRARPGEELARVGNLVPRVLGTFSLRMRVGVSKWEYVRPFLSAARCALLGLQWLSEEDLGNVFVG